MKIAPQEEHCCSCQNSFSCASDKFGICNVIERGFSTCANTLSVVLLYYNYGNDRYYFTCFK